MQSIGFYCNAASIEENAMDQLQQYAQKPYVESICAFTDIHYCAEKALPVGVAFQTTDYCYPLITGKDIGCGVMYLRVQKEYWQKPFDKKAHYAAFQMAHQRMTDDGLGGGNHFLSIEEDDEAIYVICHTGTRDRGIALYQQCVELTREFSKEYGKQVDFVHRGFLEKEFYSYYDQTIRFGYERRKNFCIKTLLFLQNARYIGGNKAAISKNYLQANYRDVPEKGILNDVPYVMEDSVHNHLRFLEKQVIHRKGSTELTADKTVVIPLSMSRGSLLVKANAVATAATALDSCAHGAGRKLSRFDAMKHWKTVLKEKQRKAYREQFCELLNRSGNFPMGVIQEFDYAYKDSGDIFTYQPYLRKITQTKPVVTVKYTEI